jgi:hypothetical protein
LQTEHGKQQVRATKDYINRVYGKNPQKPGILSLLNQKVCPHKAGRKKGNFRKGSMPFFTFLKALETSKELTYEKAKQEETERKKQKQLATVAAEIKRRTENELIRQKAQKEIEHREKKAQEEAKEQVEAERKKEYNRLKKIGLARQVQAKEARAKFTQWRKEQYEKAEQERKVELERLEKEKEAREWETVARPEIEKWEDDDESYKDAGWVKKKSSTES